MNPISSINITNNIEKFILEKNNSKIYDKIITKYNIKTSSNSLISIINNI
ncbi:MAG: hypothetical protein U9Q66_04495 [Patescibacteria group bacterium]|nr:hypothetical protein [Patescibacteria group bacterium]